MRFNKKKVLSIGAAVANLSFSIAVAGVATFAWFTNVQLATSTGMAITTSTEHIRLDYIILKFSDELKEGIASGVNDASEFILPEYDRFIPEKNKYANLIVRANLVFPTPIDTSDTEIKIDINKLQDSVLKALDEGDPNNPDDDAVKIQKLTSNVVQFKSIVTSYTLDDGENTVVPIDVGIEETQGSYASIYDAEYRTAIDYFDSRNTPTTFISLMNGQPVDPLNGNKITLVPELYNVGVVKGAVVYLECSYNEDLVAGFIEDHPNESLANLLGDIERIDFGIHKYGNSTFGAIATGQYIKMDEDSGSYNGQYLDSYITSTDQFILDGTKTTGQETIETSSGINTNNNRKNIANYIASGQDKVYPTDSIDKSSLAFDRSKGTFKSNNNHYIGNPTETDGIISNSNYADFRNTVEYDDEDAIVKPVESNSMQLKYNTTDSKFAYYGADQNNINLYRYHENDPIDATLESVDFTAPTGDDATYSLGEYFSLKGTNAIAHYSRSNPNGEGTITFTINVTDICSYVMGDIELIPEKTSFSTAGNQTVTVTYSDRGTTFTDTFDLNIIADTILSMEITTPPAKTTYRQSETFDVSDMVVYGTFQIAGRVEVLPSEYICKVGNTSLPDNSPIPINITGDDLVVSVYYTGGSARPAAYHDPTFQITVKAYVYDPVEVPSHLEINDEPYEIDFYFNAPITWTITGTAGALSFEENEITTLTTIPYNGSGYATSDDSITIYPKAEGRVTLKIQVTDKETFNRTYSIVIGDPPEEVTFVAGQDKDMAATGVSHAGTMTKEGITVSSGSCHMATQYPEYRFYADSDLTISTTEHVIKKIEFGLVNGSDGNANNLSTASGYLNGVWTGTATTVVFSLSAKTFMTTIKVYYKDVVIPKVVSLTIYDDNGTTPITNEKELSSGTVGVTTWTPIAEVSYSDNSHDTDVAWSKSNDPNDTITLTGSTISFNKRSGSVTLTATTNQVNADGIQLTQSFTLTWHDFTRKLVSISAATTQATTHFPLNGTFAKATITATYNDGETADVTNSPNCVFTGYDLSEESNQTVTVTYTEGGIEKTTEYEIVVGNGTPVVTGDYTWNLSQESFDSASETAVVWSSTYAIMDVDKANATTNANNYLPPSNSSTRFYKNSILTITPETGYKIYKVEFTATTNSYASALANSSWTNAEASASNTLVTVTPTNIANAISSVIGATCGFTAVKVYYTTGNTPPTPIPTVNSVTVTPSTVSIDLNDNDLTKQLTATVSVSNGADNTVTWTSSNSNVATVSETGLVTAVAEGSVTITATSTFDSTKYGTCSVTITDNGGQTGSTFTADLSGGTYDGTNKTITWSVVHGQVSVCTIYQEKLPSGSTNPNGNYITNPRWYGGNQVTITPASGRTITSIVIVGSSGYAINASNCTPSSGSFVISGTTATWSGSITSSTPLILTFSSQIRVQSVTITYS